MASNYKPKHFVCLHSLLYLPFNQLLREGGWASFYFENIALNGQSNFVVLQVGVGPLMINWWTAGNQIVSFVLASPFSFGDFLEPRDIRSLGLTCTSTHTICSWILNSIREEAGKAKGSLQDNGR